jgi:hypothetical protein
MTLTPPSSGRSARAKRWASYSMRMLKPLVFAGALLVLTLAAWAFREAIAGPGFRTRRSQVR